MIAKDADRIDSNSVRARAGARAEHDMAFYLRRSFGNHRPDVFVLHDLRFTHEGEVAQIDHLVIHRHGMFIIETKSVSGELHFDRHGQFERVFSRSRREGMESPVRQAERQADLIPQGFIDTQYIALRMQGVRPARDTRDARSGDHTAE